MICMKQDLSYNLCDSLWYICDVRVCVYVFMHKLQVFRMSNLPIWRRKKKRTTKKSLNRIYQDSWFCLYDHAHSMPIMHIGNFKRNFIYTPITTNQQMYRYVDVVIFDIFDKHSLIFFFFHFAVLLSNASTINLKWR